MGLVPFNKPRNIVCIPAKAANAVGAVGHDQIRRGPLVIHFGHVAMVQLEQPAGMVVPLNMALTGAFIEHRHHPH